MDPSAICNTSTGRPRAAAANSGNATAASLVVEGVLTRGGVAIESSVITVDYVAAGSERGAALFFSNDPRQGQLSVRAKGYIEP